MAMATQANTRRLPVSRAPAALLALGAVVASLLLAAYLAWSGRSEQTAAEERIRSLEATRQRLAWELDEQRQAGAALATLRQQADTAQADLDRAMADRAEVAQQLLLTQADLQLAQQTLVRITGEVREQQERLTKLEAGIGAGERRAAAAGEAQSAAAQEAAIAAAARSRELAELGQRLETLRQQEAEARRNLAVITRELEERQTERAWFEALDRAIANRADTVRELLQTQEDLQRAEQTLARTAAQAQEQQTRLARIEEEIDRAEQRLAAARAEAGALESRIASRSRELAEIDRRLETARQPETALRPDVAAMAGNGQEDRAELVRFEEPARPARASYSDAEQQQRARLTSTTVEAQQSEPGALEQAAAKQWRATAVLPAGFGGAGASAPAPGLLGGPSQREPAEPAAAVADRPALRPDEELLLLRRGDQLLKLGDIAAARLFYESAASAGSARAATALGKTHDPLFLQPARARGLRPDPAAAAEWYRRASEAGDGEAADRLKALRAKFPQ